MASGLLAMAFYAGRQHEHDLEQDKRLDVMQDKRGQVKISTEADGRLRCVESKFPECHTVPQ